MICKNCNRLLPQQINYCNGCGAKVIKNRLTLANLFEDFAYRYLNYDNQFLRTFIHLFTKPEAVIGSYINGTRKKYVNVISYFAIAITLSGFQLYFMNKFYPELMDPSVLGAKGNEENTQMYFDFAQEYQSIIYMLMVPFYAMLSKMVFYNVKKYNFTEHLVINMYSNAHFSIVSTIFLILFLVFGIQYGSITMVLIPLQVVYTTYVFKRVLNLSLKRIIIKTLIFFVLLSILLVMAIMLVVLVLFLTDGFGGAIEPTTN